MLDFNGCCYNTLVVILAFEKIIIFLFLKNIPIG